MAAESHRRGVKPSGLVVRPQAVINDKSYMGSVVDLINEVIPQANGEAQEVLSWRQGPVRALNILPAPDSSCGNDPFASKRPLVALCDSSSPAQQFCSVSIVSLKTMDQVHSIRFKEPINEIRANKRVLVVTFQDKIFVYNACTFKERFCITGKYFHFVLYFSCHLLFFFWYCGSMKGLFPVHQTRGGVAGEGTQSYTATVIHAAKTLGKGLSLFGETVASSLTGHKVPSTTTSSKKDCHRLGGALSGGLGGVTGASTAMCCPGVVSVVDVLGVANGSFSTEEDTDTEGLVAHFQAHYGEPLSALHFDPSGVLLFTADRLGHNFHLFHLMPHPGGPTFGSVQHLYTLHRGDTTAKIQDVAFSLDSRWVAVSTLRGTTHIFPITPYGGPITRRTHTSPRVVNRLSRFHKSAGLEEIQSAPSTGRNSPVLSGSPSSSSSSSSSLEKYASGSLRRLGPQPTLVSPLAQIKQGAAFSVAGIGAPQNSPPRGRRPSGPATKEAFSIAAAFAPPRAWLVGSPSTSRDKKEKNPVDSLFIMTCNGALTEYIIDPRPCSSVNKVTEDSPIELDVTAYAQWNLLRPPMSHDTKQPLSSNNPLMMGQVATNASTGKQSFKDINGMSHMEGSGLSQKENDDSWLSQVEIITHVGPHRRLWMGPQFSFKTLQTPASTPLSSQHSQGSEKYTPLSPDSFGEDSDVQSPGFSGPMSVPVAVPAMSHYLSDSAFPPLLIEATSGSFEGPPSLLEVCGHWSDSSGASSHANGQEQLMERIADAMNESPYKERQAARTSSGSELACFEDVGSRCNSDVSLYHSPSQSTEHLLVFSSTQQDSM
ncbi:hypothetical protein HPB49_023385 [Dermacentor silvarum]|uniref:Uncharacterized protein n=1 Tax=Dermacentor silvarum TaxID=543639 RepID=A0ACB8D8W3_DERSI|nr:hypothetical protein HPB49_023385 [Dermacentor silvarum]